MLIHGRATNPRKKSKSKARKSRKSSARKSRKAKGYMSGARKRRSTRKGHARRSYMHGARKRRSTGSRAKGPKLAGMPLSTLLIDSAMLAGGGFVADNVVDFVDEQVISRLGLEGPLVGVAKFGATVLALAAGTYASKRAGGKIDFMPLVYGAVSQLGASAFEDITGMNGFAAPSQLNGFHGPQQAVLNGFAQQQALPAPFADNAQSFVMSGYTAPSVLI